jgi:hypothetical protein
MDADARLVVYTELADWYERHAQASMRDRFLVLAADAALASGQADTAERLRQRLLQGNPHHLLKPYTSFAEALAAPDVETYVADLRQSYPLETAEGLLRTLREGSRPPAAAAAKSEAKVAQPRGAEPGTYPIREEEAGHRPPRTLPPKIKASRAIPTPRADPEPAGATPHPASAPAPTRPVPVARPVATIPLAPSPAPPPAPVPTEGAGGGSWLASTLFGLVLTAGIALAAYTLARPFLPPGWLP